MARFLPYWSDVIAPEVRAGRRVITAAHGNSLRALIKYLDDVSEKDIVGLNVGDLDRGRNVLSWVLQKDPNNVVAWTWMTRCTNDMDALREVHRRIEALNPFI